MRGRAHGRPARGAPSGRPLRSREAAGGAAPGFSLAAVPAVPEQAGHPGHSGANLIRRQSVDVDVEAVTQEGRDSATALGIELPRLSATANDPRHHSQYIENSFYAIGYSIYLNGFFLYVEGMEQPLYVSNRLVDLDATATATADPTIYNDYPAAIAHVPSGPQQPGQSHPAAYFWGPDNRTIVPTIFTAATTPRIIATLYEARRQLAEAVQNELAAVGIGILGGFVIRALVRIFSGRGGGGRSPRTPRPPNPGVHSRRLARAARDRGDPVVANMGGAGAPHEPAGAININNQAVGRRSIPNHVDADASDIGRLFDRGSVDEVVGYHMPPSVIDWNRAVPGIRRALRPGGRFRFDWRGGTPEAGQVAAMLRNAGFRDVENLGDALVTGTRP